MASQFALTPECVPISEPVFIPDTFASEIVAFCEIGGNYRISFASARPKLGTAPAESVVVCHLVLPRDVVESFCRLAPFRRRVSNEPEVHGRA